MKFDNDYRNGALMTQTDGNLYTEGRNKEDEGTEMI